MQNFILFVHLFQACCDCVSWISRSCCAAPWMSGSQKNITYYSPPFHVLWRVLTGLSTLPVWIRFFKRPTIHNESSHNESSSRSSATTLILFPPPHETPTAPFSTSAVSHSTRPLLLKVALTQADPRGVGVSDAQGLVLRPDK